MEKLRGFYMSSLANTAACRGNSTLFSVRAITYKIQDVITYVTISPRVGCQLFVSQNFDGKFTEIELPTEVEDCQVRNRHK